MNEPTKPQIIKNGKEPAFAVLPWADYQDLLIQAGLKGDEVLIPNKVVRLNAIDNIPMIKAWRKYLKLTQKQVADKLDISQPAFRKLENTRYTKVNVTVEKVARALSLHKEQLLD